MKSLARRDDKELKRQKEFFRLAAQAEGTAGERQAESALITAEIQAAFHAHQSFYGAPRIHKELRAAGRPVGGSSHRFVAWSLVASLERRTGHLHIAPAMVENAGVNCPNGGEGGVG